MLDSEKLAIAAHLHVVMRRKVGRVTDVEWIVKSPEYAREVIRVARLDPTHAELVEWGDKLEAALFTGDARSQREGPVTQVGNPASGFGDSRLDRGTAKPAPTPPPRYVGSLR